ncbi:elongation factor P hydroxylase [Marinomonas sp. IMCC 4694]|uniref:elongation factor P hydroxylase n=1 Tax=Marinomonas sp. IMCC 4694 TaxID=2605432 RepID=UPI0011E7EFFB|nr:elongation factor P hydroxylase [Marinomonas sp. IMCC 4694]TYL47900.1 elongation factor P hydroxylase [Marinomonas sp. IMCC 4694]
MLSTTQLICAFNTCFLPSYNTCLIGGAEEPLYTPATPSEPAKLYFRSDYASSALHEISHWCVAGEARRRCEDYGYWYESDSRNKQAQAKFEQVEVKPQAIECILHWSAGLPFRVSVDNLSLPDYDASSFEQSVLSQVGCYVLSGFPQRARVFAVHLLAHRGCDLNFKEFLEKKYENYCR